MTGQARVKETIDMDPRPQQQQTPPPLPVTWTEIPPAEAHRAAFRAFRHAGTGALLYAVWYAHAADVGGRFVWRVAAPGGVREMEDGRLADVQKLAADIVASA